MDLDRVLCTLPSSAPIPSLGSLGTGGCLATGETFSKEDITTIFPGFQPNPPTGITRENSGVGAASVILSRPGPPSLIHERKNSNFPVWSRAPPTNPNSLSKLSLPLSKAVGHWYFVFGYKRKVERERRRRQKRKGGKGEYFNFSLRAKAKAREREREF
uniref:Uncharacterized protein n=1 Tax=Opuntia streptacantha TaxID=393608 RepID=A0A7C9APT5_OPUST